MSCYICGKNKLYKFLDLGYQPPSDAFLRSEDLLKPEVRYPLELCVCEHCWLVQLDYVVDPEKLFRDYVYNTATNNSLKVNFQNLVNSLVARFGLQKNDLVIDIGSNDGTLLSYYLPHGVKILGVDPSSSTSLAIANKIPTVVDFFSAALVEKIRNEHRAAKMITATNVFAHVDKLRDFVQGVKELLDEKGVFVSESGYLPDMLEQLQFDSIYHEHLRYYSLKPLQVLFNDFGLEIFDVEKITTHGGSIRVYAAKRGAYPIAGSVQEIVRVEEAAGIYSKDVYVKFADLVRKNKFEIQRLVLEQKLAGHSVVGLGAPAKGNTLLNYCGLDRDAIDYLAEKSVLKIGLFAPGTHIPVVDEKRLLEEQPDCALMLSWNIAAELMPKIRNAGYKGKFLIPNPEPKII